MGGRGGVTFTETTLIWFIRNGGVPAYDGGGGKREIPISKLARSKCF